jgi:hypothetical protein
MLSELELYLKYPALEAGAKRTALLMDQLNEINAEVATLNAKE